MRSDFKIVKTCMHSSEIHLPLYLVLTDFIFDPPSQLYNNFQTRVHIIAVYDCNFREVHTFTVGFKRKMERV